MNMTIRDKLFKKSKITSDKDKSIEISDNSDSNKDEPIKMNHEVYISYSTKDTKEANEVCNVLEQNDIKCWIAPRDLPRDRPFQEVTNDAIKNSKLIVLILSNNSLESRFVLSDIKKAFNKKIPIINFLIDSNYYSSNNDEMKFYLSSYALLDAYPIPETFYETLVKAVLNICDRHHLSESDPLPPYDGEDKYIFVSHYYDDSDEVFPDIRKFQDLGYNVWYDNGKLANEEKSKKIRVGHLKRSDLCIVFVTNASMASIQIQKEIKYAVKHNKNMIPIYLEDFDTI